MKTLQNYIKDLKYIKLPASTGYRTFNEFLDVNNISENEIDFFFEGLAHKEN